MMTVHKVVPHADTVVYLKNACTSFAEWNNLSNDASEFHSMIKKTKKKKRKPVTQLTSADGEIRMASNSVTLRDDDDVTISTSTQYFQGLTENSEAQTLTNAQDKDMKHPDILISACKPEVNIIEYHVCSGNLMSASSWFARALKKDGWMESNRSVEHGQYKLSAEDWDEEAFLILMNIFHLRNKDIPRKVNLEMLAKISILVDYYECLDALQIFVDLWAVDLGRIHPIPALYCRDLILWLWVSWALRLSEPFKQATYTVIRETTEPIRNLGLPIPGWITEVLDSKRRVAIGHIEAELMNKLRFYSSIDYICPFSKHNSNLCGSVLLGTLIRGLQAAQLLTVDFKISCSRMSFKEVCDKLRSIRIETWYCGRYEAHECNLGPMIRQLIEGTSTDTGGLVFSEN